MNPRAQTVQEGFVLPKLAVTIPQNGVKSLYTITGGFVKILQLYGVVTVVIAGGANNAKFQFKPSGQTAVDLCAVGDIGTTPLAVGQIFGTIGPVATALATGWAIQSSSQEMLVGPGTIDLNCTAAAGTGSARFALRWLPAEPGAFVTIV